MNKLLAVFLVITGCVTSNSVDIEHFYNTSVKLVGNYGGGTGVVYDSSTEETIVLTNDHVCGAIKTGGYAFNKGTKYLILSFKQSKLHDLCYVKIKGNLGPGVALAAEAPAMNDKIYISGHPNLYPHVLSEGYVTETVNINVATSNKPCDAETSKKYPIDCIFNGDYDSVRREAVLVTALISPGSSGSGVFNDKDELVGLAFAAGGGNLGYALVVPWKFLNYFVKVEAGRLEWVVTSPLLETEHYSPPGLGSVEAWKKVLKLLKDTK
jgi:S1-C subfamily serine protease